MATRSRHEAVAYRKYIRSLQDLPAGFCAFCDPATIADQLVDETAHCYIIKNRFPYSLWDQQKVIDHLMIVPKVHAPSLSELDEAVLLDIIKTAAAYEARGYNIYARAPDSKTRSVLHQHTHLIKTVGPTQKLIVYTQKPYIRFSS